MADSACNRAFKLILVRHGQTTHNKAKIIQGQMETQLTDLGRDQAKLLGEYFRREKISFDKYYSSDLIRAHETCKIIRSEIELHDEGVILTSNLLREKCWGNLQGQTIEMIRKTASDAGYDVSTMSQFRPEGGGETLDDVHERIRNFCKNELFQNAKNNERILVVLHGGPIREFMKIFRKFGCPIDQKDLIITPNTSINEFDILLTPENRIQNIAPLRLHSMPHLTLDVLKNDSAGYEDGN